MKKHRYLIANFKTYGKKFLENMFTVKFSDSLRFFNSPSSRQKPIVRKSARKGRVSVGRPKVSFEVASQWSRYRIAQSRPEESSSNNKNSKSSVKKNKKVKIEKNVINLKESREKCDNFLDKGLATYLDAEMTRDKW